MAAEKLVGEEKSEERIFAVPMIFTKNAWVHITAQSEEHAEWLAQGINLGVNPIPDLRDVEGWDFECVVESIEEVNKKEVEEFEYCPHCNCPRCDKETDLAGPSSQS